MRKRLIYVYPCCHSKLSFKNKQIKVNNNLNHKAKTNILNSEVDYSNSNFNYSNNACSINNNTNCKDLDEIIKKRNRRVSIRDKINYFEAQKEESKILHNLVERLKQDSSLSGIASNYQFLIY